ncbi:ribosomal biogenesis protein LAS1L isoform X2 [Hemicordylus capensis]|uniref:ribosomal biogenesis protein LAS1L isoform X2 n=1 Tax=Hemicordylus capensis TaxID=884348 RepID=UPI002302B516|nr:ribosomal biogenesis protein LAS1L isoform X2 [Hemicordylus capensis]
MLWTECPLGRAGCDVVLEWLHHTYWSRQLGNDLVGECADEEREELLSADTEMGTDSSLEEAEKSQSPGNQKHQELHEKVTDVLVSYKTQQIGVLQQLQDVEETCKVWCSSSSEVEWIVAQMKDLLQENREIVAGALLGSGFLLPTAEELQILNINYRETKEWDFRIPQTFLRFWQPLLKGLHSKGFTQTLLENMFRELKQHTQGPALRSWYLISWITEILKANMQAKKKPKNSSRKRRSSSKLFLRRVPLQWLKLLDTCLEAPCGASPHLLHLLLSGMEPPLPAETQEKLLYLTSIYTQEDSALLSPNCATDLRKQPIYTVESLQRRARPSGGVRGPDRRAGKQEALSTDRAEGVEEEMETQPGPRLEPCQPESAVALAEKRVALQGATWQVSSEDVKWKNLPLGKVPGQTDDPDDMLVENYTMMSALDQLVNGDQENFPSTSTSEWSSSATEGLLWTQSDLQKLKDGLQLY